MKIFPQNISFRPSCHQCHSKNFYRNSDITLADFWGIQNVKPDMYNEMERSLVIINSKKGQEIFNQISPKMTFCRVNREEAIKYNPSVHSSVKLPYSRKQRVLLKN